ncbi:hypothetical protein GALL_371980 [mine drainage metagenome]|uniref:Uncharacterized protein n=1 Tax=mine drainage metagenome TaxID=410659 RepID=A0A1J5QM88_9ZZZZ
MFRLPQSFHGQTAAPGGSGASVLEFELRAEQAGALGRAGAAVQQSLAALRALTADDPARPAQVLAAAAALHAYLIQVELSGLHLHGHDDLIVAGLDIPAEVLRKVGVSTSGA